MALVDLGFRFGARRVSTVGMEIHTAGRPGDPLPVVLRAMAATHGVTDARSARRLGLSRRRERTLLDRGVLISPAAGVLVSAAAPDTWEQRARAAVLAPGSAVLSHGAAARLHGLAGFEHHETIEVLCRKGSVPRPPHGTVTHHTRGLSADDITEIRSIATLTVAATLAVLAPAAGIDATARALDCALARGIGIDEVGRVALRWQRPGRTGPGELLDLLDERDTRVLPTPWLDQIAARVLARTGVRLVADHVVRTTEGDELAGLALADPARRIGVEGWSWRWGVTAEARERRARRARLLGRLGWQIVEVRRSDLDAPRRVEQELIGTIGRTRPRPRASTSDRRDGPRASTSERRDGPRASTSERCGARESTSDRGGDAQASTGASISSAAVQGSTSLPTT